MARPIGKLSATYCSSAHLKPGRHSDGGGLYLSVAPAGTRSWVFVWTRRGKKREMGLGGYPAVKLADARKLAEGYRSDVSAGRDPISVRDKEAEPTFGECADQFLDSMQKAWTNAKHRAQWKMTLEVYCAKIRDKRVSLIDTDDVLKCLTPIWNEKPETASRLRGRIERVLAFASAKGWRWAPNSAIWRGHLRSVLPSPEKLSRGHHAAMPYKEVPAFLGRLKEAEAMSARALEFLILTVARSGEVLGAVFDEFDLDNALWVVPGARMKAGAEHRVPLAPRAVAIVRALKETKVSDFVFPGERPKRPLSNMAFAMLMRRMKVDQFTAHGFRSSFRDWAGDETTFQREVIEAALAHEVGNKTELAYRRSDALAKRRKLMEAWTRYLSDNKAKNVVPFGP